MQQLPSRYNWPSSLREHLPQATERHRGLYKPTSEPVQRTHSKYSSTSKGVLYSILLSNQRADCSALSTSFLKMISVATAGGTVINYSPRFSIAGMTGNFPANVIAGIGTVSGTAGPATENNVVQNQPAAGGGAEQGGKYAVPYTLQTGLTKYAPMQPQPPTKITAQSATPLWPTSAVVIATTWLPRPSQVTTSTQVPTYSVSSMENSVSSHVAFPYVWPYDLDCCYFRLPLPLNHQTICRNFWLGGEIDRMGIRLRGRIVGLSGSG